MREILFLSLTTLMLTMFFSIRQIGVAIADNDKKMSIFFFILFIAIYLFLIGTSVFSIPFFNKNELEDDIAFYMTSIIGISAALIFFTTGNFLYEINKTTEAHFMTIMSIVVVSVSSLMSDLVLMFFR